MAAAFQSDTFQTDTFEAAADTAKELAGGVSAITSTVVGGLAVAEALGGSVSAITSTVVGALTATGATTEAVIDSSYFAGVSDSYTVATLNTGATVAAAANTLLVVIHHYSRYNNANAVAPTISDDTGLGLTWTSRVSQSTCGGYDWVRIWTAPVSTGFTGKTITVTDGSANDQCCGVLGVWVVSNYDTTTPAGTPVVQDSNGTTHACDVTLNVGVVGSQLLGVFSANNLGASNLTAASNTTPWDAGPYICSGAMKLYAGHLNTATTATGNTTFGSTTTDLYAVGAGIEIRPGAGSSTNKTLGGSAGAITSTAVGGLAVAEQLAGVVSAITSTVAATLGLNEQLAGSVAAITATVTGAVTHGVPVAGSVAAVTATVAGDAKVAEQLAGSTSGAASVSQGGLAVAEALAGSVGAITATVVGDLSAVAGGGANKDLAGGVSAVTAVAAGTLAVAEALAGATAGAATVALGGLAVAEALAGGATGTASVSTGGLVVDRTCGGAAAGAGSAVGAIVLAVPLAGDVAGLPAAVVGDLSNAAAGSVQLAGSVYALKTYLTSGYGGFAASGRCTGAIDSSPGPFPGPVALMTATSANPYWGWNWGTEATPKTGEVWTRSMFHKMGGASPSTAGTMGGLGGQQDFVNIDFSTHSVTGAGTDVLSYGADDYGNGWWRYWMTFTGPTIPVQGYGYWTGATGVTALFFGPQLERGPLTPYSGAACYAVVAGALTKPSDSLFAQFPQGVASVEGYLVTYPSPQRQLEGSAAGGGSQAGALAVARALVVEGCVGGTWARATLAVQHDLAGAVGAVTAVAAGAVTREPGPLAGAVGGVGAASAAASLASQLATAAAGACTVAGAAVSVIALGGAVSGSSTAACPGLERWAIVRPGEVAGSSSAAGDLAVGHALAGSIAGTSDAAGFARTPPTRLDLSTLTSARPAVDQLLDRPRPLADATTPSRPRSA